MKYGNRKTEIDGLVFDSRHEAKRWLDLCMLERQGHISGLERQVALELVPGVKLWGEKRARPAIRLIVDFRYEKDGQVVWEDAKGMETILSRTKRHMAKALHGVDVRTV